MTNWQTKRLGDVLEKIEGGGTPSKEKKEFWDGSIPWASVKDLTSFNPKETQDYITDEGLKNSSSRLVKAGTLITPTRMALGFTVRFDIDVAINQDLKALYPIDDMSTEFIQYWFEAYRKTIERLGTGSTVAGIQVGELRALKIQAPEKPEQERIVGVLEVWDEYIEKLEQKIALKEQLKKGLMQQLLTGKRRLPGYSGEWQSKKLGDLVEIKKGSGLSKDLITESGSKCVLYGEIYTKYDEIIDEVYSRTRSRKGVKSKSGDVLVPASTTTSNLDIATATSVHEDGILLGGDINILRPKISVNSKFLSMLLSGPEKINLAKRAQGITIVHLYGKDFIKMKISLPSKEEQDAIVRVIETVRDEIKCHEPVLDNLKLQKKYLLKNLITGTIRTPEDLQPLDSSRLESSAL